MAALSLTCKQCHAQLRSVKEAQAHGEATGHSQFEESTAAVLKLKCTACGKPCRSETERQMHERMTGHSDYADETSSAQAMDTEVEMAAASAAMQEALKGDSPSETCSAERQREEQAEMVPASVNVEVRKQLEDMGFDCNKATRALHFGGGTIEAAIAWMQDHEDDADIAEPLLVLKTEPKKQMSKEEADRAAAELRQRIKEKREKEEAELEKLREKERIRSGKELAAAKKQEETLQLKRNLEARRLEKAEEEKARAKIRVKLEEDRRARRRKLGLPEELTEEEKAEEAQKQAEKAAAAKKTTFVAVKAVTVAEKLRAQLVAIKKGSSDEAGVKTCFETLLKLLGNVARDPQEEKYRTIKLSNAAIQQRLVKFEGALAFLEMSGFKRDPKEEAMKIAAGDVDPATLNAAGSELHGALHNPFFGVL